VLLILIAVAAVAYLLGSIPFGYIAGRFGGVDIRAAGSGNIGATNVTRVLGKSFGYPVFFLDFAKGFAAVGAGTMLARARSSNVAFIDLCAAIAAMFAVLGHSYPIWLRFRGGKGVATSLGALFAINWIGALAVCVVWIIVFQSVRYVSLASLAAAIGFPVAMAGLFFLKQLQTPVLPVFALALAAIVIWRHRSNISRLLNGTEPRFNRK
jgi:acyl phosphate:glycerol-3-phosphate acyltransferase